MYIYIYTYIHACMHAYIHSYIHTYINMHSMYSMYSMYSYNIYIYTHTYIEHLKNMCAQTNLCIDPLFHATGAGHGIE